MLLHRVFSHIFITFFRDRQRSNAIDGANVANYDLYFDDDNDVDDDDDDADDEYVCDVRAVDCVRTLSIAKKKM